MKTTSDIDREAAAWIARIDAAGERPADFQAWIDADIRHRIAYLRLNAAWERTALAERLRPLEGTPDPDLLAPAPAKRATSIPWLAAAAIAVITVGIVAWLAMSGAREEIYRTGVGHFERLKLADGSTIELNTDSEVRVRLSDERRLVSLTRGEAHFTVAHDTLRPFDVQAGGTMVRAVGTAFSVRMRDEQHAEVMVTEGRVAIAPIDPKLWDDVAPPKVGAGELAIVAPQSLDVQPVNSGEATKRLAWIDGKLVFSEDTLRAAVDEFNRYNRKQLRIGDPELAALHVGGTFEATDVPSFLAALDRVFGVKASVMDSDTILLTRAAAPIATR